MEKYRIFFLRGVKNGLTVLKKNFFVCLNHCSLIKKIISDNYGREFSDGMKPKFNFRHFLCVLRKVEAKRCRTDI